MSKIIVTKRPPRIGRIESVTSSEGIGENTQDDEGIRKTHEEWYEDLPEPWRIKALTNMKERPGRFGNPNSLSEAINSGFSWNLQPEGRDIWERIYEAVQNYERDISRGLII